MGADRLEVETLTRAEAAKRMGVSPRTLSRMVKKGELRILPTRKFAVEDVEAAMELAALETEYADDDSEDPIRAAMKVQSEVIESLGGFAERQLRLLEDPIKEALSTLIAISAQNAEMLKASHEAMRQHQSELGDILLRKAERDALDKEAEGKREALASVGKAMAPHIPTLLHQIIGTKAGGGLTKDFSDLVTNLSPTERSQIGMLANMFEGEQRDRMVRILGAVGVKVAAEPEVVESND